MVYSIKEMIGRKGRTVEETDYAESNAGMLDFHLLSGDFYKWEGKKLRFKECVNVMDFAQTVEAFPPFASIAYKSREKLPYFAGDIEMMSEAWRRGETIAVEGGPCLFGEYDVSVTVELKNGQTQLFDYANGKAYLDLEKAEEGALEPPETDFSEMKSLADYLRVYGEQVDRITFHQEKQGLTPQEYLNLRYPFELAAALRGPLVIPIPDMSYRKYLLAVLDYLPEAIRARTLSDYDAVVSRILAYYQETIHHLQGQFRIDPFLYVHGGCQDELERWYSGRKPFIERGRALRNLTRLPEKIESIKDYITMPALPYYLLGVETVLQVDSVDEADSYRKCKKAHKRALRMGCILLPELLSGDGVHTIYNAPAAYKEYADYHELEEEYLQSGRLKKVVV